MQKIYFKNSITTLLIISFIVMPFYGIPKKAEAQSLGAYVTGLAPAITQLPLCKGKLGGATKSLFTGNFSAAWSTINEKLGNKAKEIGKDLGDKTSSLVSDFDSIKVSIEGTAADAAIKETNKRAKEIEKSTTSLDANDTCLKNIGRMVIKMLLQKMTMSTVNWINTGFEGKPSFIQDSGKFFGDIAKNEVLQFGAEINNEALFPFGKAWIRNQAEHFNNKFADNARYSLDELIRNTTPQYSATGFWLNFDQGGWGAWSAMTQYPQNNSLGFQLMASNELQRRLAGTTQSVAQGVRDALQAADGFLGDQRCADPVGVTREEHNRALAGMGEGLPPKLEDFLLPYDDNATEEEKTEQDLDAYSAHQAALTAWKKTSNNRVCNRWEYVTPGKLIAEAATSTIHYPENNLLKADDLNDAMAAIMDALLARFSNDLMQKGYANLGNEGSDGTFAYDQSSFSGDNTNQTEKDFRPVQLASSWLSANPDFNIRTDLTQALIDEQRTYIQKLELQNKELNSTTDGKDYSIKNPWVLCAREDATCSFAGEKKVRFGANGSYYTGTFTKEVSCNAGPFGGGDPNPNIVKACEYYSPPVNNGVTNAYGLIPTIDQLDYCIPGPHPGWEEDSKRVLDAITNTIIPENEATVANRSKEQLMQTAQTTITAAAPAAGAIVGGIIGSSIPVVGTLIGAGIGMAVGSVVGWIGSGVVSLFKDDDADNARKVRNYYSGIIHNLTGLESDKGKSEPNASSISSKQGAVQTLNTILERYIDIMHTVYNEKVLPSLYRDAYAEFNKLPGYAQIIENNKNAISEMNSTVSTLEEIKTNVDALNIKLLLAHEGDYENQLQPQINAFGRVSANMVNGDDIAETDNLLKQIIDEKEYVYKDLLKGPLGCEQELQNNNHLSKELNLTIRMEYPFPILYTYDIEPEGLIPDIAGYPEYKNKTNKEADTRYTMDTIHYGPGFLGFYNFQAWKGSLKACIADEDGKVPWCQLQLDDFFAMPDDINDYFQRKLGNAVGGGGGPFEHSIRVY